MKRATQGRPSCERIFRETSTALPPAPAAGARVPALPETFVIGRDGKIVDKIIGLRGKAEIEDSIKKALDTKGAASQASSSETNAVSR